MPGVVSDESDLAQHDVVEVDTRTPMLRFAVDPRQSEKVIDKLGQPD